MLREPAVPAMLIWQSFKLRNVSLHFGIDPQLRRRLVNQRLLILGLVLALLFALAAISRLIVKADLPRDKSLQEVPQAAIRDDLDIRLVTERTPYMRTER
jgi:hypothetical protein